MDLGSDSTRKDWRGQRLGADVGGCATRHGVDPHRQRFAGFLRWPAPQRQSSCQLGWRAACFDGKTVVVLSGGASRWLEGPQHFSGRSTQRDNRVGMTIVAGAQATEK